MAETDAWGNVAGLMVGQEISERVLQMHGPAPSSASARPTWVRPELAPGW
ncbi:MULTISPECIES: hypothetical protein [unclassified Streptomyces]|nr:hypothetical protein [Streptomyces sp. NBC_00562]WUC23171.1 hypothetical protein OHA33_32315 [Streptomyces sp. NBC_00562]